jgi:ATP-dependent 26S proteasome regulatory subunit
VIVNHFDDVKVAKLVHVLPILESGREQEQEQEQEQGTGQGSGKWKGAFLDAYVGEDFTPLKVNDKFACKQMLVGDSVVKNDSKIRQREVQFKVMAAEDESQQDLTYFTVGPDTEIFTDGEPLKLEEEREFEIGYDEIGGCEKQITQIRELVELPLKHPEIFTSVGIPPPKGVLLYGPPGSGTS